IGEVTFVDRVGLGRPAFDDEHLVENRVQVTVGSRERNDGILIRYRREELSARCLDETDAEGEYGRVRHLGKVPRVVEVNVGEAEPDSGVRDPELRRVLRGAEQREGCILSPRARSGTDDETTGKADHQGEAEGRAPPRAQLRARAHPDRKSVVMWRAIGPPPPSPAS